MRIGLLLFGGFARCRTCIEFHRESGKRNPPNTFHMAAEVTCGSIGSSGRSVRFPRPTRGDSFFRIFPPCVPKVVRESKRQKTTKLVPTYTSQFYSAKVTHGWSLPRRSSGPFADLANVRGDSAAVPVQGFGGLFIVRLP